MYDQCGQMKNTAKDKAEPGRNSDVEKVKKKVRDGESQKREDAGA